MTKTIISNKGDKIKNNIGRWLIIDDNYVLPHKVTMEYKNKVVFLADVVKKINPDNLDKNIQGLLRFKMKTLENISIKL